MRILFSKDSSGPFIWVIIWDINSANQGMPENNTIHMNV